MADSVPTPPGTSPGGSKAIVAETVGVTRHYPGVVALDGVDFSIRRGEVRALLGQNGAGKSTLIRLLSGVEEPDEGRVLIGGTELAGGGVRDAAARGVATCYQELSLVAELSVAENLFLGRWPRRRGGLDLAAMTRATREALDRLGVHIDPGAEAGSLTLAQQQLVEIARALRDDPRLLILDEPTSALASAEVAVVLDAVRRVAAHGVAVIYVSHRMDEIRQVARTATVMRNGQVVDTVDVSRSDTAEIIRLMLGADEADVRTARPVSVRAAAVLEVRELALQPKLESVSLTVHRGEVLGIAGLLGSGRTELLKAVAGFVPPTAGEVRVDGRVVDPVTPKQMRRAGIGLAPEDRKREGVLTNLGVDENIVMSAWGALTRWGSISSSRQRSRSRELVDRLHIRASDLGDPIGALSGGNQQKAVIARWLHADTDVLLLDEPTRGVDVEAKAQIYEIVRQVADQGKAVLFVSSELEELPLACDRVLVLRDGRVREEFTAPDIHLSALLQATMASTRTEVKA